MLEKLKVNKFIIITALVLMFFSALAGFLIAAVTKLALLEIFLSLTPTTVPLISETNVLVLGLDGKTGVRSDTIMVVHINPNKKEISVISIPRDTLTVLPGRGLDKINHAFAYGGVDLARKTVMEFLQVEIPYYVAVDIAGLASLIDGLGGVTLDVEKRMYYVDYSGGVYINLHPGLQKLSGRDALGYLRYRQDGGDLIRITRQQKFLKALGAELFKRENIFKTPQLFLSLLSHIETNLSPKETLGLSLGLRSAYELGRVNMASIPGFDLVVDGIYYWKPDYPAVQRLIEEHIRSKKVSGPG